MKNATCIGCGCDENHACPMDPAGMFSCWWLRFDADANTGVCSACWDLVPAWKRGEREPHRALIADRFYRQALFLYEKADALAWVASPNSGLGGRSPRELILDGELRRVLTVLDQIRSSAFAA